MLMILINFALNLVFQTCHKDKDRNSMKNVTCATLICDEINGFTVISNFNDFVTDLQISTGCKHVLCL